MRTYTQASFDVRADFLEAMHENIEGGGVGSVGHDGGHRLVPPEVRGSCSMPLKSAID